MSSSVALTNTQIHSINPAPDGLVFSGEILELLSHYLFSLLFSSIFYFQPSMFSLSAGPG